MFATNLRECPTCGEFIEGLENCWRPGSEKPEEVTDCHVLFEDGSISQGYFEDGLWRCNYTGAHVPGLVIVAWSYIQIPGGWREYVKDEQER